MHILFYECEQYAIESDQNRLLLATHHCFQNEKPCCSTSALRHTLFRQYVNRSLNQSSNSKEEINANEAAIGNVFFLEL